MGSESVDVSVTYRTDQSPVAAFETLALELEDGLSLGGISIALRAGGAVELGDTELGEVTSWEPGTEIGIRWNAMPWGRSKEGTIRVRVEAESNGSRVTWSLSGWAGLFDADPSALPEWVAGNLLPGFLRQLLPGAVGDWSTDRSARRPGGARAIENYRDPTFHWPNFWLILDRVRLRPDDRLLEVGCGGGAFLHQALDSGCSATGVDHSLQMVKLARRLNAAAIRSDRLDVVLGDAGQLPVDSDVYTCCVSTGAIGFFPNPLGALREMFRALAPGGRLAVYASTEALRGTPAAPEPVASRVRFFTGPELTDLARRAGFSQIRVEEPAMEPYARKAGVPPEAMPMFRGTGGSLLLLATKPVPSLPRSRA